MNSDLLRSLSFADIGGYFAVTVIWKRTSRSAARLMEEEASLPLELEREEEAVMLYTKVFQLYLKSACKERI